MNHSSEHEMRAFGENNLPWTDYILAGVRLQPAIVPVTPPSCFRMCVIVLFRCRVGVFRDSCVLFLLSCVLVNVFCRFSMMVVVFRLFSHHAFLQSKNKNT